MIPLSSRRSEKKQAFTFYTMNIELETSAKSLLVILSEAKILVF